MKYRVSTQVFGFLGIALSLSACNSGEAVQQDAALSASTLARSFGVGAYVVSGDTVAVRSVDGAMLGTLQISEPTAETRQVEITYGDGKVYTNDITRPIDGRFAAPVGSDRDGAIQADPALASLFAGHALAFNVIAPDPTASSSILEPLALANCANVTFTASCTKYQCYSSANYWNGSTHVTQVTANAACNMVTCGWPDDYDKVAKAQTCSDPGSCSTAAIGWVGCLRGCGNICDNTTECYNSTMGTANAYCDEGVSRCMCF